MDELRKKAREFRSTGDYKEAVRIYVKMYSPNCDKWIAWEYADSLKKCNDIDTAIDICKDTYESNKDFKYNNDLYSWLLFEKHFKLIKDTYQTDEIVHLYNTAILVTELVSQNISSPYENTLIQTIKILSKHSLNQWDKVLVLINKLDLSLVSDKPLIYNKQEKEIEYQSSKEMIFAYKIKALFDLNRYEDCIKSCNEAFSVINKFHHDNDTWINLRKAKSIAALGDIDKGIELILDISIKKIHWDLYYELAKMFVMKDDTNSAMLYFCKAAITKDPPKMKVTLYFEMATLYYRIGNIENARLLSYYAYKIRISENWNIPTNLNNLLYKTNGIDKDLEVDNKKMTELWVFEIYRILGKKQGVVSKVQPHGKTGFISCGKDSYYFKMTSVINTRSIKQGDNVIFCLMDSYDQSKNKITKEAGFVKFDKR
jgi:tetratricopeptide (TPR) repeat protein